MFDITTNQVIKIHKGDDSGSFPLFLNQGTAYEPVQYKFYSDYSIISSPDNLSVYLDKTVFSRRIAKDGFYDFEYNYLYDDQGIEIEGPNWYLNSKAVKLETYGIKIEGESQLESHIIICRNINHISEIYFYIVDQNSDLDCALVKKTIRSNCTTTTEFADCRFESIDRTENTVDKYNQVLINLHAEDTQYLKTGEYCYQIRAKLYDFETNDYIINTVTNRLPFYVVDGEDSIIW